MPKPRQNTRDKIFNCIRKRQRTVEDLSIELGITPAAVRSQMNTLEREGLVVRGELLRNGVGQPAIAFKAADGAEDAFSSAYKPLLVNLLDTLPGSISDKELNKIMRDVGRKIADSQPSFGRTLTERVENTADALEQLGALVEVVQDDCDIKFTSYACPLAAAVKCRPQVCTAVKAFIAEATSCTVKEKCHRDRSPLVCEFILPDVRA